MRIKVASVALCVLTASCIASLAGDKLDGAAIYTEKCVKCHGDKGQGEPKALESVCEGLTIEKLKLAGSAKKSTEEVRKQIVDGTEDMPGYKDKLTAEEVDAVIAHVRALVPAAADKK
jgi:mono/diheme cytochrome c family protein